MCVRATGLYWNKLGYVIGASSTPQNECTLVAVMPIIQYIPYTIHPPLSKNTSSILLKPCTIARLLLIHSYLHLTSLRVVGLPKRHQRALTIIVLPLMMRQPKIFNNSSVASFQIINLIQSYTRWSLMDSAGQFGSMENQ